MRLIPSFLLPSAGLRRHRQAFRLFARLAAARDGVASLEFALSFPLLAMMIVGTIEFGMIQFTGILMESGLRDASRYGITGYEEGGVSRFDRIVQIVSKDTLGLVDLSTAQFQVLVYPGFNDIGRGEDYVDGNGNGQFDAGETFTDENGNGVWDADIGVPGPGGSGDVVVYRILYNWPLLTPLASTFIGHDGKFPIRASVTVRNEPWDSGTG